MQLSGLKKKITSVILILLFASQQVMSAYADGAGFPAAYLSSDIPAPVLCGTLRDSFANQIDEENKGSPYKELYSEYIFSSDSDIESSRRLISSAEKMGLILFGTFSSTPGCSRQYSFLTESNGFRCFSSEQCAQFGGTSYRILEGDILFWFDENDRPCNLGIVTKTGLNLVYVSLPSKDGSVSLKLTKSVIEECGIQKFCAVEMKYPSVETLVFLFCKNELKLSSAAACGITANLFCESSLIPDREEDNAKNGYGICQWSFERREEFENYCKITHQELSSAAAQFAFLKKELDSPRYTEMMDLLRGCRNTEADALDAAYFWCSYFENPSDVDNACAERAELVSTLLWPQYGTGVYVVDDY